MFYEANIFWLLAISFLLVFTIFHVVYLIHNKEICNKHGCSKTLNHVLLKSVQAKELFKVQID